MFPSQFIYSASQLTGFHMTDWLIYVLEFTERISFFILLSFMKALNSLPAHFILAVHSTQLLFPKFSKSVSYGEMSLCNTL